MKPCPDHKETLLLDLFGELNPNERSAWENHLETCEGCRGERQQVMRFLDTVRVNMPSPALSRDKAAALAGSINRKLMGEREQGWWRKRLLGVPNRFIPALAAASILIGVFGWFGVKGPRDPSSIRGDSNLKSEEQILVKDLDIIMNLELLEEMDTLQKLVRVVDHRDVIRQPF